MINQSNQGVPALPCRFVISLLRLHIELLLICSVYQIMGVFATKPFERNEEIEGQGKSVLLLAKRLMITKYELDRIYHEFRKNEDPKTNLVDIAGLFIKFRLPYTVYFSVLFQLYDINKTGMFNFQEYLVMMWAFLSASDDNLSSMSFNLFDLDRSISFIFCLAILTSLFIHF